MRDQPSLGWRGVVGALAFAMACLGSARAVDVTPASDPPLVLGSTAIVGLGAVLADAPEPNAELQVLSVSWAWSVLHIYYEPEGQCGVGAGPGEWSLAPDPAGPDATLTGTGLASGAYIVVLDCTVTYTMSSGPPLIAGTQCTVVVHV